MVAFSSREFRGVGTGTREAFAKQPDGLGIRNPLIQIEPHEPHEGQPVVNLIFGLVIGQIIEAFKHKDFEHEDHIKGRTAALLLL